MVMITRRTFTLGSLSAGLTGAVLTAARASAAPAGVPMDPNDPMAKGLGFVTDAKTVNVAANPTFKATQSCASCGQYQGKGLPIAPCNVFAGKTVPAGGWCRVWVQRP